MYLDFFSWYLLFIYVKQPVTQVQSTSCGCKVLEKKYNNFYKNSN